MQKGREEVLGRKMETLSMWHCSSGEFATARISTGDLALIPRSRGSILGRATHAEHTPLMQRRCSWHTCLELQTAPTLPGCDSGGSMHTLFLQMWSGRQPSAASQRWPAQPKAQEA